MNGYLLDTNVISELTKASPAPSVVAFLSEYDNLWTSSVVLHELEFGLRLLPRGRRREDLEAVLSGFISEYENRVLPLERREAEWAARLRAQAHLAGRALHLGDALIAGTAMAHNLSVATRNAADFDGLGIPLTNPWDSS
jgi:predicted nucleic acid-binding protein